MPSRAVVIAIGSKDQDSCQACSKKINSDLVKSWVVANVYEGDKWDRIEHYHVGCYKEAGKPYGEAVKKTVKRARRGSTNDEGTLAESSSVSGDGS